MATKLPGYNYRLNLGFWYFLSIAAGCFFWLQVHDKTLRSRPEDMLRGLWLQKVGLSWGEAKRSLAMTTVLRRAQDGVNQGQHLLGMVAE